MQSNLDASSACSTRPGAVTFGAGLLMLAAIVSGCASGPQLKVDQDPAADLKSYKTFAFVDKAGTDRTDYSSLLTAHLKRATRVQLEKHGYSYVEQQPDLRVNFFVGAFDRQELRSLPAAGRVGARGWSSQTYDLVQYRQGVLRIDLVDAQRNALVWQGIAEQRLDEKAGSNSELIDAAVGEIFARLPSAGAK
jgi:hypothetical protein